MCVPPRIFVGSQPISQRVACYIEGRDTGLTGTMISGGHHLQFVICFGRVCVLNLRTSPATPGVVCAFFSTMQASCASWSAPCAPATMFGIHCEAWYSRSEHAWKRTVTLEVLLEREPRGTNTSVFGLHTSQQTGCWTRLRACL